MENLRNVPLVWIFLCSFFFCIKFCMGLVWILYWNLKPCQIESFRNLVLLILVVRKTWNNRAVWANYNFVLIINNYYINKNILCLPGEDHQREEVGVNDFGRLSSKFLPSVFHKQVEQRESSFHFGPIYIGEH